MSVGGKAAEGDKQPSCWTDADYDKMTICFDGDGRFIMSVFYEGAPGEAGHGGDTSGRYWGSDNVIHFETEWPSDPWPWSNAHVRCVVGGPPGVMALSRCVGSKTGHLGAEGTAEDGLTLIRAD